MKTPTSRRISLTAICVLAFTMALFGGHSLMFFLFGQNGLFCDTTAILFNDRVVEVAIRETPGGSEPGAPGKISISRAANIDPIDLDLAKIRVLSVYEELAKNDIENEIVIEDPLLVSLESQTENPLPSGPETRAGGVSDSPLNAQISRQEEEEPTELESSAVVLDESETPVCPREEQVGGNKTEPHKDCPRAAASASLASAEQGREDESTTQVGSDIPLTVSSEGAGQSDDQEPEVQFTIPTIMFPGGVREVAAAPVARPVRRASRGKGKVGRIGGTSGLIGGLQGTSSPQRVSYQSNGRSAQSNFVSSVGTGVTYPVTGIPPISAIQVVNGGSAPVTSSASLPVSTGTISSLGGSSSGGTGINLGGSGVNLGGSGLGLNLGINLP